MLNFKVKYKSFVYSLEMSPNDSLGEIFVYLSEIIDVNKLHCKLLISGKSYTPDSSEIISNVVEGGQTLILMMSSLGDVVTMNSSRSDPLVKGFEKEISDEQARVLRTSKLEQDNPWGSILNQHETFRFTKLEVFFKRQTPPPFEAEKLLKKLSLDPGILAIMESRKWTVGVLCELDPEDADDEQAAKGEADKCLLGWNRNFGQRIALRLRTDDLKGFRKYDSIVNTLLHELAHNVFGPHNHQFWTLFNQLKQEYTQIHATRKNTKTLSSASVAPTSSITTTNTQKLGGSVKKPNFEAVRLARIKALEKS